MPTYALDHQAPPDDAFNIRHAYRRPFHVYHAPSSVNYTPSLRVRLPIFALIITSDVGRGFRPDIRVVKVWRNRESTGRADCPFQAALNAANDLRARLDPYLIREKRISQARKTQAFLAWRKRQAKVGDD